MKTVINILLAVLAAFAVILLVYFAICFRKYAKYAKLYEDDKRKALFEAKEHLIKKIQQCFLKLRYPYFKIRLDDYNKLKLWACNKKCNENDVIKIPKPVDSIGGGAFVGCNVKSIILPDKYIFLHDGAFDGCHIKELTVPNWYLLDSSSLCGAVIGRLEINMDTLLSMMRENKYQRKTFLQCLQTVDNLIVYLRFVSNSEEYSIKQPFKDEEDIECALIYLVLVCCYGSIKDYTNLLRRLRFTFEEINKEDDNTDDTIAYKKDIILLGKLTVSDISEIYDFLSSEIYDKLIKLMERLTREYRTDDLNKLLSVIGAFKIDVIDDLMALATEQGSSEVYVILIKYKHEHYGGGTVAERFEL